MKGAFEFSEYCQCEGQKCRHGGKICLQASVQLYGDFERQFVCCKPGGELAGPALCRPASGLDQSIVILLPIKWGKILNQV